MDKDDLIAYADALQDYCRTKDAGDCKKCPFGCFRDKDHGFCVLHIPSTWQMGLVE